MIINFFIADPIYVVYQGMAEEQPIWLMPSLIPVEKNIYPWQ